jgi:hypothetical protein
MANFLANNTTLEYAPVTQLVTGVTLPASTLTVQDTTGFSASGSLSIGTHTVAYTGKTATTFTGCTGGTGAVAAGERIMQVSYTSLTAFSNDFSVEQKVDDAETTKYGTLDKTYIPALRDNTAKFMVLHEDNAYDGTPQALIDGIMNLMVAWRYRSRGVGIGKPERTFDGFITSVSEKAANDGSVVGSEISIRVNGAITTGAQA